MLSLTARKLFNFVFAWVFDLCDSETWDRNFAGHFDAYRQEHHEYLEDRDERIKNNPVGDADINIEFVKPSDEDVQKLLEYMKTGVVPKDESTDDDASVTDD